VYDEQGRHVGSVITRETEWDVEQQSLVLAAAELDAEKCPGCGELLSESTSTDVDPDQGAQVYVARTPLKCHACVAIEGQQENYRNHDHAQALRVWGTDKRDNPRAALNAKRPTMLVEG